jgi:hypothetical protein
MDAAFPSGKPDGSATPVARLALRPEGNAPILLRVAVLWFVVHAAVYAICVVTQLDKTPLGEGNWWLFVCSQALGLLAVLSSIGKRNANKVGAATGFYLLLSTIALLAVSQDIQLITKFALFILWMACAIGGMRHLLGRTFGGAFGTWGLAVASVYAALVPACFLLGLIHAITPGVVAFLAIATASPGAVLEFRRIRTTTARCSAFWNRLGTVECLLAELTWLTVAIAFVCASTIPVLSDAPRVHLPYIHQLIADGGLTYQYPCWHRLQVMAFQVCCATFATIGSDLVGTWLSWFALPAIVGLIGEEVFRRSRSLRLSLCAAAAVLCCPILVRVATSLQIDHIITLLCTAGMVALFRSLKPLDFRGIFLSAMLMGVMAELKYTGVIFAIVWWCYLAVLLLQRCRWQIAARVAVAAGIVFVLMAMPWYIYVYLGTGNPVYPFLLNWFPSPYWVQDYTQQAIIEQDFKLRPGIFGVLAFPWDATYNTHRLVHGLDGFMGYLVLGLAPCWFLRRSRLTRLYRNMMLVGLIMVAAVVAYTPYTRYWMPAYPLLTASCVLAAGATIHGSRWQPKSPKNAIQATTGLVVALLLCAPLAWLYFPRAWIEYSKQISTAEHVEKRFPGYDAIKKLNTILKPNEGVLCTDYDGVYLIHGPAYAFPMREKDPYSCSLRIYQLHDVATFTAFCRRYGIRYWVVYTVPGQ